MVAQAYSQSATEVLASLQTSAEEGLSPDAAATRLTEHGPNALPEASKDPAWLRFVRQFQDVMIYVLLASAVLTAVLGEWVDTAVIVAVVLINAIIGFVQEGKSEAALEGIKNMLSPQASVLRAGSWREVAATEVVPGDVVRLQAGDKIPADLRLITATNATAEESALTGESVPADKSASPAEPDAPLAERHSMAYSGTLLAAGSATGVVVSTGQGTEIGRINTLMGDVEALQTPLTRQIDAFTKKLAIGVLVAAVALGLLDFVVHSSPLVDAVLGAVGFAVAAIPEGLPALITITLALGVQTLAGKNAIARKLPAVQTLGSVTTICTDKTGTLTKNEMTVTRAVTTGQRFDVEGTGYEPRGAVTPAPTAQLDLLARIVGVTNETDVAQGEDGRWGIVGEPTEGALKSFALKLGADMSGARHATLPFSSEYKFMATTTDDALYVKGAPDVVLGRSTQQLGADGTPVPLDRAFWDHEIAELSDVGLRVLSAAYRPAAASTPSTLTEDAVGDDLIFVGLLGIVDPPRPEAIEAIADCHRAGIVVKMITGDAPGTAAAIAQQMGITDLTAEASAAVTGRDIEAANDDELVQLAHDHNVFARTSPEHKLRLVRALQSQGQIVSMTGDGVNDAPALRRADVGVAMGIKGTEVTKESAEIVLADDNFATISRAVHEGRRIWDNLRKALVFLLVTNGAQSLVMLLAILFGWLLPLSPLQILWVNTVTAITLAFAYAFEPAEADTMARPPLPTREPIMRAPYIAQVALASALITAATMGSFYWLISQGVSEPGARTAATTVLVMAQSFYLFNVKALETSSLKPHVFTNNKVAWLVVGLLLLLQAGFIWLPFMHTLFGTAPLPARAIGLAVALGLVVFLILEVAKPLLYRATPRR